MSYKRTGRIKALQMAEDYQKGLSLQEVARFHGCHHQTVSNAIRRWAPQVIIKKPGHQGNKLTIERVVCEAIARQYDEGMTTREIADLHDIHENTAYKIAKRHGATMRQAGRPRLNG